jgi:hypothetical protein
VDPADYREVPVVRRRHAEAMIPSRLAVAPHDTRRSFQIHINERRAFGRRGSTVESLSIRRPIERHDIRPSLHSDFPVGTARQPALRTDLIIRFLAKSLPQASPSALGIAGSSDGSSVAFIFYDRIVAIRSHTRVLPVILGRVMAHEITHLLLPDEHHSQLGLMRAQWSAEDLRITTSTSLGLPGRSVLLMQREALRRAMLRVDIATK